MAIAPAKKLGKLSIIYRNTLFFNIGNANDVQNNKALRWIQKIEEAGEKPNG